jgi:hypothetical protein
LLLKEINLAKNRRPRNMTKKEKKKEKKKKKKKWMKV